MNKNTDKNEYISEFAKQLNNIGIKEGDSILVHSSLKSLGEVPGGCQTVIDGLLKAVGKEGTLLFPALSYMYSNPENPFFSVNDTMSNVGAIPEYFRKMVSVKRSVCPTHSVCGIGKNVDFLLDGHISDNTPCGPNSPFRRLSQIGGKIVFIGCGINCNTSMHSVEELSEPPYLFADECEYDIKLADGKMIKQKCRAHNFQNVEQRYDRVSKILNENELKSGKVFDAMVYVIDSKALFEKCNKKYQQDPMFFVDVI